MEELVGMSIHDDASFDSQMNEDETQECLFVNLRAILTSQLDHKKTLALQANAIRSMQQFPDNEAIRELGCKILACIYGSRTSVSPIGMEDVMKCITSTNEDVVAAAASACRNLCSMQMSSELDSYEMQRLVRVCALCNC